MIQNPEPASQLGYRTRIYMAYVSSYLRHSRGTISAEELDHVIPTYDAWFGKEMPNSKESRILDVGCGYGNFLYWAIKRGYTDITGVDLSQEQVVLAQEVCPQATIICASWQDYFTDVKDGYDLISCLDVVEHLTRDEFFQFLDAAFGALKPGGKLLVQTINGDGITASHYIYGDLTHETILSPRSMTTALRICGFDEISIYPTNPVAKNLKGLIRRIAWSAISTIVGMLSLIEVGTRESGIVTRNMIVVACRMP